MKNLEKFNDAVLNEYNKNLKAVWMVPGCERDDYCILVDNIQFHMNKKKFDHVMSELKEKHKVDVNVKLYELTKYFKEVTANNLEILNEMSNAVAVYDPDSFFTSMKNLMDKGQVLGTQESVVKILDNVKERFKTIENYKKQILFNSYKAVVDAASAALIARNISPPIAVDIPKVLKKNFVKKRILEKVYISIAEDIIKKYKAYEHGKLSQISGKELGVLHEEAFAFVERMKTLVGHGFSLAAENP